MFELIEEMAHKGYSIEYVAVDQYQNGYGKDVEKGLIPAITYTLLVYRIEDCTVMYTVSLNHIEECLKEGIRYVKDLLNK